MRHPHFFKACSRLGLINAPVYTTRLNIGVEDAPDFILSRQFLEQLTVLYQPQVSKYVFPRPEDIKVENYWQVLASSLQDFKDLINKNIKPNQTQIVIGGDNSVTFSSLIAVQKRLKDPLRLGYLQFDSHGESNKLSSSPKGNFHGMYMRPFFSDDFEVRQICRLVKSKIPIKNVICFGNLDLDGDEPEFFQKSKIRIVSREEVIKSKKKVEQQLRDFIKQFEHIHINFDVDVMDETISLATGIPTKNGFFPKDLFPLLEIIRSHPRWSLDIVETNPRRKGAAKTVAFAQEVIKFLLEK